MPTFVKITPDSGSILFNSGSGNNSSSLFTETGNEIVIKSFNTSSLTRFKVDGSQGTLFQIDDTLSGSLFSVNDISGLPILEVFSDDILVAGKYNRNDLVISSSRVGIGTNTPLYKLDVSGSIRILEGKIYGAVSNADITLDGNAGSQLRYSNQVLNVNSATAYVVTNNKYRQIITQDGSTGIGGDIHYTTLTGSVLYITSSGNVGIGTSTPDAKVHIFGPTASIDYANRVSASMILGGVADGNKQLRFYVNDTNGNTAIQSAQRGSATGQPLLLNPVGGDVGIGTTSPTAKLHVSGNVLIQGDITIAGSSSIQYITSSHLIVEDNIITLNAFSPFERYAGLEARDSGSGNLASILWDGQGDYWTIVSSSGQSSKIIGTAFGTQGSENNLTTSYIPKAAGNNSINDSVIYQSGSNIGIGNTNPFNRLLVNSETDGQGIVIKRNSAVENSFADIGFLLTTSDVGHTTYFRAFRRSSFNNNDLLIHVGQSDAIMIKNSGNVGIGNTSPTTKLHISGSTASEGLFEIDNNVGNTLMYVSSSGNVGINTFNPSYNLHVSGSARFTQGIEGSNSITLTPSGNPTISSGYSLNIQSLGGDYVALGVANNTYMTIRSSGNIGIGTTSPSSKLHINGGELSITSSAADPTILLYDPTSGNDPYIRFVPNTTSSAFALGIDDSDSDKFKISYGTNASHGTNDRIVIDINGNVGINTTSPTYKLQVNGTFAAISKSFIIQHPTKLNKQLVHGSLEGPEYGVYIRGELKGNEIILPDYWEKLIDEKTITVQLTSIKKYQKLVVDQITSKKIIIKNKSLFFNKIHCYYTIYAERKDIDKLQIEI